jgi:hypothetical protein
MLQTWGQIGTSLFLFKCWWNWQTEAEKLEVLTPENLEAVVLQSIKIPSVKVSLLYVPPKHVINHRYYKQ